MCRRFSLRPGELLEQVRWDFRSTGAGEPAYLTWEMVRDFIQAALELCQKELDAMAGGGPLLDPWDLAWNHGKEVTK